MLDQKLEKLKGVYENLLRLALQFTQSDYEPKLDESIKDVVGSVLSQVSQPQSPTRDLPATHAHALSRATMLDLNENDPVSVGLSKFSATQERAGNAKLRFNGDVQTKFIQPWSNTLKNNISTAVQARKKLMHDKHQFDLAKTRLKHSKDSELLKTQEDMNKWEMEYNDALRDAEYKYKLVVDSPEALRNLHDLALLQANFHKEQFELMNDLQVELDELRVTQEALFRN